jgi:uncharacterized protein YegP (UPF0339 family)
MTKWFRSLALLTALAAVSVGGISSAQEKAKEKEKPAATQEKAKEKPAAKAAEKKKAEGEGKFEVYQEKGEGKKFRFRIYDKEGTQVGMAHKGYEKREEAVAAIKAIQEMAGKAKIEDEK